MSEVIARGVYELIGDNTQFDAAMAKAEATARRAEKAIVQAAGRAAESTAGMGKGAKQSSDDIDAATRKAVTAMQRLRDEVARKTLTPAAYAALRAELKGLTEEQYGPLIARLAQVDAAQRQSQAAMAKTAQQLGLVGVSAGQATAALRQLPAQFTDIVTSLASGQNVLTVFLQQGGQIKDSFGGASNALRAVASAFTPLRLAVGGGVALLGALTYGLVEGTKEAEAYTRAIVLTGNAAGVTAQQLAEMAKAVASRSGGTQGLAAEGLTQLVASAKVGRDSLEALVTAAIRLERVGGPAVKETAEAFTALAKSPFDAAAKLNETVNFLTQATAQQIKALEDQGRTTDAARVAQEAYAAAIEQRVPQIEASLGLVERAWRGVKEATQGAIDQLKDLGREDTLQQQIDALESAISMWRRLQGSSGLLSIFAGSREDKLREQLDAIRETVRLSRAAADAQRDKADTAREQVAWLKEGDKLLSKEQQYAREVVRIRESGMRALASEEEIARRIAAARDKIFGQGQQARSESDAYATLSREIAKALELAQADAGLIPQLSEARKLQVDLVNKLASATTKLTAAQREQAAAAIAEAVSARATAEERRRELEALRDSLTSAATLRTEFESAVGQANAGLDAAQAAILDYAAALEDAALAHGVELRALGLDERQREILAKQLQIELRLRQQIREIERLPAVTPEQRQRRDDLVQQARDNAARASEQVAEQVDQVFETRVYVNLRDGLTDAILEGGRGGAQKLQDLFKQIVLRPIVQAGVSSLMGSLGLGGGASGAAGWLSQASGLSSVYNGLVGGSNAFSLGQVLAPGGGIGGGVLGGFGTIGGGISNTLTGFATSGAGQALGLGTTAVDTLGYAYAAPSAAGSALAAAGPYIAAAAAIYAIAKSLDSSGTPHFGGYASFNNDGTRNAAYGQGESNRKADYDRLVAGIIQPVGTALNSLVDTFQLGARFATAGTFKAEAAGKDGGWGVIELLQAGGVNVSKRADGTLAGDPTAAFEDYARLLGTSVREAVDALDLPGWADGMLAQLDESAKTEDILATIGQIVQTEKELNLLAADFLRLGGVFSRISGASDEVQMQLAGLFGGVQQLGQATSGYYQNYYTEAERFTISTQQVSEALAKVGLAVPPTREAFRALVDAQDPLTDSGRQALATLLGVQQAFADLNPAVQAVADSSQAAAEAARAAAEIQRERQGIEVELLRLQGDTQALRERELAALDPSNRALKEQVFALQDAAAAQQAYLQVTQEAAQANQRAIQDMAAAAQQVVQAQSEVRGALQAIYDYGQGIRDNIAQTEAALEELRTRAAANVQSSSERVAQALRGLSDAADGAAAQVSQAAEALDAAKAQRAAAATAIEAALQQQQGAIDGAREGLRAALQGMADAAAAAADRVSQAERTVESAKAQRTSSITSIAVEVTRQQGAVDAARDGLRAALQGMADAATAAADRIVQAEQAVQAAKSQRGTAAGAIAGLLDQQRGTVAGARGGVQSALEQLRGNVDAAVSARESARSSITTALLGAEQAHAQALARLTDLQDKAAGSTADLAAQMGRLSASITDYLTELTTSSAALANRPDVARAEFDRLAAQAQAGDATAAAQLIGSAKRVLDASRDGAGSGAEYDAEVRRVRQVLAAVGATAAAAAGPSEASSSEQALAAAVKAVADSQFEVERLRAIAIEAGASLTAEKTDLLAVWRSAQDSALAAERAYADATLRAHALGIDEVTQAGSFAQALAVFTGAQTELEAMLGRVSSSGVDLTLADSRDALQKQIDDYKAANAAVTSAEAAYALAVTGSTTAANSLAAAMAAAAAAGVTLAPSLGSFAQAMSVFNAAAAQLEGTLGRVSGAGVDLAGADTRDPLQKLLDDYKAANTAVTTAEAAYALAVTGSTTAANSLAAALTSAAAAGVALTPAADAFGQALTAFNTARGDLVAMNTAFAGLDLSWAEKTSPVQKLVDDYNAATTAISTAQSAYETAVGTSAAAATSLAGALTAAAAAGVTLDANTGSLAGEFASALNDLRDARAAQAAVGNPAVAPDLLTQYGTLQAKLTGLNGDLATFNERVNELDFSGLADLDPLGTLLQTYSSAVATLLGAVDKQQTLSATGQFVDIGGGFQRYTSSGGAVGIVNSAGAVTVFGKDGRTFGLSAIQEYVAQLLAANDLRTIYNEAVAFGMSSADLDRFANGAGTPTLAWARSLGLPAFASGGDHAGGLRLVGEYGPELEATGPARYFDSAQTQRMLHGTGDATAAEMRALRAEVIALRQEIAAGQAAIAGHTLRTTKVLERASAPNGLYTTAAP